ncbi:MAG: sigma-70 family RNA polymerase sigma factor [Planctomycetota bacterium]
MSTDDPDPPKVTLSRELIESMAKELLDVARSEAQRRLSGNPLPAASPSDLAQSALVELLREPERFDYRGPSALRGLVKSILVARVVRRLRARRAAKRDLGRERPIADGAADSGLDLEAPDPGPVSQLVWRELVEEMEARVRGLDERSQRMLAMAMAGRTLRDIAESEGVSEASAQKIVWRARQAIKPPSPA